MEIIKKYDSEVNIERNVAIFNYNDNVIEYILNHQYFNATQMAQSCNKDIRKWLKRTDTSEDIYELAVESGLEVDDPNRAVTFYTLSDLEKAKYVRDNNFWNLVRIKKGNSSTQIQGTFINQELAIALAKWCSPQFRRQVDKWIKQLMSKGVVKLDDTDYLGYQQYKQLTLGVPSIESSEDNLSYRIQSWVNLCRDKGNFLNEVVIKDNIDGESYLRRIDFINKNPRNIVIYELKRHKITVDNIVDTIHDKKYLKLCRQYFKKPVRLVMLSPLGITPKAQTLIDEVINFDYQSTQQFCESSYDYGIKHRWQHNIIELRRRCFGELHKPLFSNSFLQRIGEPRGVPNKNTNTVNKVPC